MEEQHAWLALNAVMGLGPVSIRRLAEYYGSAAAVLAQTEDSLIHSGIIAPATAVNIVHFSEDKFWEREYNLVQQKGAHVVCWADDAYPSWLKDIPSAPVVLYILGNPGVLSSMSIGMVGSRRASHYGLTIAGEFAQDFAAAGLTVVSGMALGIDGAAHRGALRAHGKTVAVLGCGLAHVYPKSHAGLHGDILKNGAVISEMPMDVPPLASNFPRRNRIISGLSQAIIVVEAAEKSGALITADYALEQGKDIYAVPANIDITTAAGSNQLLKDGARIALSAADVLNEIGAQMEINFDVPSSTGRPHKRIVLSEDEMKIYNLLSLSPLHIDNLALQSKRSVNEVSALLLNLELKGIIQHLPGTTYVRK